MSLKIIVFFLLKTGTGRSAAKESRKEGKSGPWEEKCSKAEILTRFEILHDLSLRNGTVETFKH